MNQEFVTIGADKEFFAVRNPEQRMDFLGDASNFSLLSAIEMKAARTGENP
jgi:hypothetical protein